VAALAGEAVRLVERAEVPHRRRAEAGLLRQLAAGDLLRRGVRLALQRPLRELPVPAAGRVAVLLDEVEPGVVHRDDDGEVRLVDDAVEPREPSARTNSSSRSRSHGFS
jgi:hypothetical protein